jgi:hypothetical protein
VSPWTMHRHLDAYRQPPNTDCRLPYPSPHTHSPLCVHSGTSLSAFSDLIITPAFPLSKTQSFGSI